MSSRVFSMSTRRKKQERLQNRGTSHLVPLKGKGMFLALL